MISRLFMLLTLATHIVARPTTKHNIVQLDYGSFQGGFVEDLNITYWEKIPFAAPPVGGNRFRAPQPPLVEDGIYNSTQPFDMCPQDQVTPPSCPVVQNSDNIRMSALRIAYILACTADHGSKVTPFGRSWSHSTVEDSFAAVPASRCLKHPGDTRF